MRTLVKILAGTITVCITFLAVTALYLIWAEVRPNSPFLWRCSATAGLVAFVCAVLLSLCDTILRHRPASVTEVEKSESEER